MTGEIPHRELGILILAAGKATRMKSRRNKVLHPVAGKPMLTYVLETARALSPQRLAVVIGHQGEQVKKAFAGQPGILWVRQKRMLGTGDAVACARQAFSDFDGSVLVMCGDAPGIRPDTLGRLVALHNAARNALTVLTAELPDPTGYGRIVPDREERIARIVEEKDATRREREIKEINTGIFVFDSGFLFPGLELLRPANEQKELYLTDLVGIARTQGKAVGQQRASDPEEVLGVNTREELARVSRLFHGRKARDLMENGVTLEEPDSVRVDPDVTVGPDAVIGANVRVSRSRLGPRVKLGRNVSVADADIEADAEVGANTNIGGSGD